VGSRRRAGAHDLLGYAGRVKIGLIRAAVFLAAVVKP